MASGNLCLVVVLSPENTLNIAYSYTDRLASSTD